MKLQTLEMNTSTDISATVQSITQMQEQLTMYQQQALFNKSSSTGNSLSTNFDTDKIKELMT